MYDYYYGPESEQFAFYRIPKLLFEAERVRDISTDAKLLYGLMLDRMQLSAKNGWLDENGRVYIYYTVKQIMNALSCSNKTVTRLLNELEGVHLISREKSGFSKPDRIYVMNFLAVVYKVHHETCKKYTSGDVESTPRDMYNLHPNNTDNNKTDISDTESIVSIRKNGCDAMDEYRAYESLIRENIEFDHLVEDNPYERESLEEIVSIMTDVLTTKSGTIRISGDEAMCAVMDEEKKPEQDHITLKHDVLKKYFPKSYTPRQMEEQILKLLDQWQKKRERSECL